MKIGIITWFTGSNYGTNLQAIALQYFLRTQGHDVKIINYEVTSSHSNIIKCTIWQKISNKLEYFAMKLAERKYGKEIQRRDRRIRESINCNCVLTDRVMSEEHLIKICNSFDLLVCGSDQIWNPNWYHPFYYADYDMINTRRISYAPSMGVNTIPDEVLSEIARSVAKFDAVSVREERAAELLSPYTKMRPEVVVDPTLLLNKGDWEKIFPKNYLEKPTGGYVLSLFLTDNSKHWKAARLFVREHRLQHAIVPYRGLSYFQRGEIYADAGLRELLDLIRDAKYVLTDSFHITVFSIINQKQFYTFQRFQEDDLSSQNIRVSNLLKTINLEDRLIPYGSSSIPNRTEIDFSEHNSKLKNEIWKSKYYLKTATEEEGAY